MVRPARNPRLPRWITAFLRLTVCLVSMAGLMLLMGLDVQHHLVHHRGLESGLTQDQAPLNEPRFGVNVSLQRYPDDDTLSDVLEMIRGWGFGTIRQRFSWAELEPVRRRYRWERWDRVLPIVQEHGLKVIAVLDTSPAWARPPWESENPWAPPTRSLDYARFVRAFAGRYGDLIMAYQIWDQPNAAPHWGSGPIDPGAYVELLRLSSEAIRGVDSDARIVAGGLAPNTEPGGRNMSDLLFLREIYRRGAGAYFDVLGVKPYGFWSGPDDRRAEPEVLNFSRTLLLRREMVRRGEAHKPIWALESGWCTLPTNWQGRPSPQGSDTPFIQAERWARAILRVRREWPWMGLMCMQHVQPEAPPDDPLWGYALLGPDGEPQPLLERLASRLTEEPVLYPGLTPDVWLYLCPVDDVGLIEFWFWGSDLALAVEKGLAKGRLIVYVDAQQSDVVIDLGGEIRHTEWVRIGGWVPADAHRVRVQGTAAQIATLKGVRVGHRPDDAQFWYSLCVSLFSLILLGLVAIRAARQVPWGRAWAWAGARWAALPESLQWAVAIFAFLVVALSPSMVLRLGGLALYGLSALLRPDQALLVAVACIPLAPLQVRLGPGTFSLTEVSLLVAAAGRLGSALFARSLENRWPSPPDPLSQARHLGEGEMAKVPFSSLCGAERWDIAGGMSSASGQRAQSLPLVARLRVLDWAVLVLLLLSMGTSFVAEYQRVAFRELRVIVGESALLYLLLRTARRDRTARQDRPWLLRLADMLWLSSVCVALYGLARYPQAGGVIEAEGVRRARAFYGSPNNLALYMERILPLGLAMMVWGKTRWRRWVYSLGTIPIALVVLLTFSRGAWLLGIPASLLALAWVRGGRARWIIAAFLLVGVVALIPLAQTERFSSLLDPSQGTFFLRLSLWQSAWDMVRDHPWFGVGLDNFLYYYGDYIRPGAEVERWLSHPHNLVLDFWLRLGIGGVVLVAVLLVGFFQRAFKAHRTLPEGDLRAVTLGLIAGMAAFVAHGSIDSSYFVIELAHWFMFALAWIVQNRPAEAPCIEPRLDTRPS